MNAVLNEPALAAIPAAIVVGSRSGWRWRWLPRFSAARGFVVMRRWPL